MNFRRLRYFHAVARQGSFRRAAEVLRISQPALSRQIQILEREIGTSLFSRAAKRVMLTPAGNILFGHSSRLLDEIEAVLEEIRRLGDRKRNELTLGAIQSTLDHVLPRAIDRVHRHYPQLHLTVQGFRSDEIIDRVARGTLDLGVVATPVSDPRLDVRAIAEDRFVAVVSSSHRLAGAATTTLKDVLAEPLITFPRSYVIRQVIAAAAAQENLKMEVAVELEIIEAIKALVRSNVGVSILPGVAVLGESGAGALRAIPFVDQRLRREIACIHRASEEETPGARHLVGAIGEVLKGPVAGVGSRRSRLRRARAAAGG